MSKNTIGNPPVEEKMHKNRGTTGHFSFNKGSRHTGKVGSLSQPANDKVRDSSNMKKPVSDPRLT